MLSEYSRTASLLRSKYGDEGYQVRLPKLEEVINEYFSPILTWRRNIKSYMDKKFLVEAGNIKEEIGEIDSDSLKGYYNGLVFIPVTNPKISYTVFLSAFLLQGIESRIIFDIILNEKSPILSYEYDGILSEHLLDLDKVNSIIASYGLDNLKLVQKKFESSHYDILTKQKTL